MLHFNEIVNLNPLEAPPCIICITLSLPEGLFSAGSQQLHSFFSFAEICKSDFLSCLLSFSADAFFVNILAGTESLSITLGLLAAAL